MSIDLKHRIADDRRIPKPTPAIDHRWCTSWFNPIGFQQRECVNCGKSEYFSHIRGWISDGRICTWSWSA